jgi:hypothetical protein
MILTITTEDTAGKTAQFKDTTIAAITSAGGLGSGKARAIGITLHVHNLAEFDSIVSSLQSSLRTTFAH